MTPAGTSNELDVQNEWEENTHTHICICLFLNDCSCFLYLVKWLPTRENCKYFSHISKIEDSPTSFADVERSQYQDAWNDFDYSEFSDLCNSNAFRRLKKEELLKNANNVVTGKWVRKCKADDRGNVIKSKSRMVARGFGQIHYVDVSETFAPTTSAASVKINVAVANEKVWLLRHLLRHKTGVYPGALGRSCIHEASPWLQGHEW